MIWKEANKRFDEYGKDKLIGTNGFYARKAHWSEHPDRDESWADQERSRIGDERFRREHECEFLIFDETLINSVKLAELEGGEPLRKFGQTRWYKDINPNFTYVVSLDPSLGTGGDYAAIQVFELPTFEQVGEWHHNQTPMNQQIRILQGINKHLYDSIMEQDASATPQIFYSMENNAIGEARAINSDLTFFKEKFIMPVEGIISGVYGSQRILNGKPRWPHYGIDIAAKLGTMIKSSGAGIVTMAEDDLYYTGGTIIMDHGHGISTIYSHLENVLVSVGDKINQGDVIGTVGSTGRSTGPHLDFRINWFQTRLDPMSVLK